MKVLLYSGGMDSYIVSKLIEPDVNLYIDIKSRYSEKEIENLKNLDVNYIIDDRLDLSDEEMDSAIVPMRNLFFVMIGLYYGDEIYLAATLGDTSNDKDFKFVHRSKKLLRYVLKNENYRPDIHENRIDIQLPAKHYTKTELVKEYLVQGFDPEMLYKSISCYNGKEGSCGDCKSCFRKAVSFVNNGIYKPELFETNPFEDYEKHIKDRGRENAETENAIQRMVK